jgi:hypothetical protein
MDDVMNKHSQKPLISKHVCAIALLTSLVAQCAQAQTPKTTTSSPGASVFFRMSSKHTRTYIDRGLIGEFNEAWQLSGDGTNGRESVVLIFRMWDGSYQGKSQGLCNEYKKSTFKWNPAAIAIVHTHPNNCDPRPSANDQRVAEEHHVLMFTITISGMYEYDPATRKTSKVLNGLAWLDLASYPEGPKKWFAV